MEKKNDDFSHLPEVAWINILQQLSLKDRYSLSQTCHTLTEHFHHPSVWHTVTIKFTAEDGKMPGDLLRKPEEIFLTTKYKQMIEQFGGYFQDLTLVFYGVITGLTSQHREVLAELGKTCRLKSLTLEVGIAPSTLNQNDLSMSVDDLESIATAVTSAFRMKSFYLKSWPSFQKVNILNSLMTNERIKNLETLNILYRCAAETTWTTVNAPVPEPEHIVSTVQHFENLTSLSLRSDLLTEEVVLELAKIGGLKNLQVMVIYSSRTKRGLHVIESKAWAKLARACPELSVHLNFVNRIPYIEKAGYMKAEIPVTAISFMKYSECCALDIQSITDKYCRTLSKFINYSDSGDFDEQLVSLVSSCINLVHFASCGPVMKHTVLQLAGMRGQRWKSFQVKEDKIKFRPLRVGYDEDTVIAKTSSGEIVMTQIERSLSDMNGERTNKLRELDTSVCQILHRKWSLLPPNFLEEDLQHLTTRRFDIAGRQIPQGSLQ